MQFESDFQFDMDDRFSLCIRALSCWSTGNSLSSTSSAYDLLTPTSGRSTTNDLPLDFGGPTFAGLHLAELTSQSHSMSKYSFGPVKSEPEHRSFPNGMPTTPIKQMDGVATPDYDHMPEINMASQHSMGFATHSEPYPMFTMSPQTAMEPTSFMMTPTHSLSAYEVAETPSLWSCTSDSPISFLSYKRLGSSDMEAWDMERHLQSPLERYHIQSPPSSERLRAHRKTTVHKTQPKSTQPQSAHFRASRKGSSQVDTVRVNVVRRAMCKCDYPDCHKAYRRNEHLKRHKQTFHDEGHHRFSCEFCDKGRFNRRDNLNDHRKLHARPNSRDPRVEFIPAAVSIIEQEERSRKRRVPRKPTTVEKRADDF